MIVIDGTVAQVITPLANTAGFGCVLIPLEIEVEAAAQGALGDDVVLITELFGVTACVFHCYQVALFIVVVADLGLIGVGLESIALISARGGYDRRNLFADAANHAPGVGFKQQSAAPGGFHAFDQLGLIVIETVPAVAYRIDQGFEA